MTLTIPQPSVNDLVWPGDFERHPVWEGALVGRDDAYEYIISQMTYNWRLHVVEIPPDGDWWLSAWSFAWCYRGFETAYWSFRLWDRDRMDEPLGWHKRPMPRYRRAPLREQLPQYNRPRCRHGSWLHEPCAIDPYCREPRNEYV